MRIELRLRTAIVVLVAVLALITGSAAVVDAVSGADEGETEVSETVVLEGGAELWPYTSRSTSVHERTLAINLVVYGDAELTETLLRTDPAGDWEDIDESEQDVAPAEEFDVPANQTTIGWGTADGAIRYTYVEPPNEFGRWLMESYQVGDGDYLGSRHHVRAYRDPAHGRWTAMQAHLDYWDWFHLRHNVPSTEESQLYVEAELGERQVVKELKREPFHNARGADSNGWVTIIRLHDISIAALLVGLIGSFGIGRWPDRWNDLQRLRGEKSVQIATRVLSVLLGIVGLYILVRFGAIWTERQFTGMHPKLITGIFYPVLIGGMPIVAYLLSRPLGSSHAFIAASAGFILAIFVDFTYLGVLQLPLDMFVHRIALSVALGFIAAGASQTARAPETEPGYVRTGVLLWLAAIVMPLLQFL